MKDGRILLAAFDMDGTLLEQDSSWVALHKHFGTTKHGEASLKLYSEGKIDYGEFMRRDIGSWPPAVTRDKVDLILSKYRLRPEAKETVAALRKRGVDSVIVTSGIDILAEKVASDLGITRWVANGLRFDRNGMVLPNGVGRVDPTRKDVAYRKMLSGLGIPPERTIAVGDTAYDITFLKSARKGFMLAHSTRVNDPEIIHIEKLTDILAHL
ncbi:MAG: HAD-IB family phosphatase [Thaumarchaeota archaeon]|nr:HAD-IB family phosphatase [Nitrososphaerota archaeon]